MTARWCSHRASSRLGGRERSASRDPLYVGVVPFGTEIMLIAASGISRLAVHTVHTSYVTPPERGTTPLDLKVIVGTAK